MKYQRDYGFNENAVLNLHETAGGATLQPFCFEVLAADAGIAGSPAPTRAAYE